MTTHNTQELEARVVFAHKQFEQREFPSEGTKNMTYQIMGSRMVGRTSS